MRKASVGDMSRVSGSSVDNKGPPALSHNAMAAAAVAAMANQAEDAAISELDPDDQEDDDADKPLSVDAMLKELKLDKQKKKAQLKEEARLAQLAQDIADLRGESRLAEKQALIAKAVANDPMTWVRGRAAWAKSLKDEAVDISLDLAHSFTPAFIHQQRQHRHYALKVARAEASMGKIYADLAQVCASVCAEAQYSMKLLCYLNQGM